MRWSDIRSWPNSALSRQVQCAPHRWHVQETGEGETVVLLHGAGASTHSYRAVIPVLARHFHVVAFDLPGQGFTRMGARDRCGLTAMTDDIARLFAQQGWRPTGIIGHSAGAAIALQISGKVASPRGQRPVVIGINAALGRFDGIAGVLFPVLAKLLAALPFTAGLFSAASASPARIQSLIRGTGSELDSEGVELYRRLVADRDHVDATLLMMAQWSLDALLNDLPNISTETHFIVGAHDLAVPPKVSVNAAARMPCADVLELPGLGHMAHEEAPGLVAERCIGYLRR